MCQWLVGARMCYCHLCETNKRIVWWSLDGLAEEPGIEYVKFCEITFLWTALNHTNAESMQSEDHTKSN